MANDSLLPISLSTSPYTWGGYTFQTKYDGEITTDDPLNPDRSGCYWDRYAIIGIPDGTTVAVYMGNSSTIDDYLMVERNGSVIYSNDDSGDGERSYDAFLVWTFRAGDVIRATTYAANTTGTYSIWISSGSASTATVTNVGNGQFVNYQDSSAFDNFQATTGSVGTLGLTGTLFYAVEGSGNASPASAVTGTYGTLSVDPSTGNFSFSPSAQVINGLADSRSEQFNFVVTNGTNTVRQTYTVGINGVNDAPSGYVAINGIASQGQTLTAASDLSDVEGLGAISYQWSSSTDGSTWNNVAIGSTLFLAEMLIGQQIRVTAYYTDGQGTVESMASSATTAVTPSVIYGDDNSNTLSAYDGNETIYGQGGNDTIYGLGGNDVINGGTGLDTLAGGAGNDAYVIDSTRDVIVEQADQGNDSVLAAISESGPLSKLRHFFDKLHLGSLLPGTRYYLPENVENFDGQNSDVLRITGNALDNRITGSTRNDVMFGGSGNDVLISGGGHDRYQGGMGADTFVIDRTATMVAAISDFSASEGDKIGLDQSVFGQLFVDNSLNPTVFGTGTSATTQAMRLYYDNNQGALYFDQDGSGRAAATKIAAFASSSRPALTASDFVLVAGSVASS